MKKIWIDGFEANVSQRVGSGQVAFELLKNIEKLDHENEYTILLTADPLSDLPQPRPGFQYKKIFPNRFKTWFGMPAMVHASKNKPDVFFSPTHYLPRFLPKKIKKVMMIFDLAFLHFEDTFTKRDFLQLKNWTGYSINKADAILTISQSSKKDILNSYKVDSKKVTVTYCGYDNELFQPVTDQGKIDEVKLRYGIEGRYVVFLGTIQPRKNLLKLIEAFSKLSLSEKQGVASVHLPGVGLKLVIVGKTSGEGRQGWKYQEILEAPKRLGIEDKIIFAGFVPSQDLPAIFSGAEAYLLPSLWEGFGIPAVEAMACGTPAIVSNVSSLPEVVGDAGLLVDPNSVTQIEQAIRTIASDQKLHAKLAKMSLERAKKFSWEKMAKETIKVLEEV
jgi:glycosyltransferase involved in cell wall biosynthesis